jgi:hypothetical protein
MQFAAADVLQNYAQADLKVWPKLAKAAWSVKYFPSLYPQIFVHHQSTPRDIL